MKLQKLIIHNLASIEDAEIDFASEPLSSSDVFLITGKTGSGKSTLLDAICLALYANTPRLENTHMQGDTQDQDRRVMIYDPRQLMRRHTGESFTTLTFIGSNNIPYEATWSVARARNKPTGNLQGKKWSLTNLNTGHTLTRDDEIRAEIAQAVGLDFSQFCRTTLLAQGEFTRFLNSKDDEKAEILEKITGVDSYSKIGKKVYELTAAKEAEWKQAQQAMQGVHLLSDEELQVHRTDLEALEQEASCKRKLRETLEQKRQWLQTEQILLQQVQQASEAFQLAWSQTQQPGYLQKKDLAAHWKQTLDAQNWVRTSQLAIRQQSKQQQLLEIYQTEFVRLKGGLCWLQQCGQQQFTALQQLTDWLASQQSNVSMYEHSQVIIAKLQQLADAYQQQEEARCKRIEEEHYRQETLAPQRVSVQTAYQQAQADLHTCQAALKIQEEALQQTQLIQLRHQKEEWQAANHALGTVIERLQQLVHEQQRRKQLQQQYQDQKAVVVRLEQQLPSAQALLQTREAAWQAVKTLHNQQCQTVDSWAKEVRSRLHVGDCCPVCRQPITKELPQEDLLVDLFTASEHKLHQAEQAYQQAQSNWLQLQADFNSQTALQKQLAEQLASDHTYERCEEALQQACQQAHLTEIPSLSELSARREKQTTELQQLTQRIEAAEQVEEQVKVLRQQWTEKQRQVDKQQQLCNEVEKLALASQGRSEANEKWMQLQLQAAQQALDWMTQQGQDQFLPSTWKDQPKECVKWLQQMTTRYQQACQQQQQYMVAYQQHQTVADRLTEVLSAIITCMPAWSTCEAADPVQIEHIESVANALRTKVHTAQEQCQQAVQQQQEAQDWLDNYLHQHLDFTLQDIERLSGYTTQQMEVIQQEVMQLHETVLTQQTILRQKQEALEQHRAQQLICTQEDTWELLTQQQTEVEQQLTDIGEKKGALGLLFRQDTENRLRLQDLAQVVAQKQEVYQQWSRLNQLIGDASGKKFRKIAQSYVLSNLIRVANDYMRTLTPRYVLRLTPGTFVILLEDAYQGYVTRAASTLSGGESFLVSLALALALSDLGQRLSVDTLFIDEGFGTLSGDALQQAVDTLRTLRLRGGRHVGIISHVEELRERIPVQIQLIQEGHNSSSLLQIIPTP